MKKNKKQYQLTTINIDQCFTFTPQSNVSPFSQIFKQRKATPKNIQHFIKHKPSIYSHQHSKDKQTQIAKKIGEIHNKFHSKFADIQINRQSFKRFLINKDPIHQKPQIIKSNKSKDKKQQKNIQYFFLADGKVNRIISESIRGSQSSVKESKGNKSRILLHIHSSLQKSNKDIKKITPYSAKNKSYSNSNSLRYKKQMRPYSAIVSKFDSNAQDKQRCNTLEPWTTNDQQKWEQFRF